MVGDVVAYDAARFNAVVGHAEHAGGHDYDVAFRAATPVRSLASAIVHRGVGIVAAAQRGTRPVKLSRRSHCRRMIPRDPQPFPPRAVGLLPDDGSKTYGIRVPKRSAFAISGT
jgi:hypothetical protein